MKYPIKVTILDREYLIKSDENEEHVRNVTRYVNDKFMEIKNNAGALSESKSAILASFHIASEYFQAVKEQDSLLSELHDRARLLIQKIDSVMS